MAACIGTWSFGLGAVVTAAKELENEEGYISALERGINVVELDKSMTSVGLSGRPNSCGQVELDAAIMDGSMLKFGAVAAIKRIDRPISVARKVLEESPHSLIVGEGATQFAVDHGFTLQPETDTTEELSSFTSEKSQSHDTMSMIVLDKEGNLAVGVSTSGAANKYPGRVGDSPLPGSGLYADNKIGAAAATGDGDDIMRFCCSYQVVQYMKQGYAVQTACDRLIEDIAERIGANNMFEVAVIAMDTKGNCGAAGTVKSFTDDKTSVNYPGFPYAVWHQTEDSVPKILVKPAKDFK